jgi:hypothetical protein
MKRILGLCLVALGATACMQEADEAPDLHDNEPSTRAPSRPKDSPPAPPPLKGTPAASELDEAHGVFVAPGAPESGAGTRAAPVGTIEKGIELAQASNKRVYVCEGTFREAVTVAPGVSILGGLDCRSAVWEHGTGYTRIESPTSPAIRADSITVETRVEALEVIAPDAKEPSGSSIALMAKSSDALTFARSRLVAGRGADGASGTEAVQLYTGVGANGTAGERAGKHCATTGPLLLCGVPDRGAAGGVGKCNGAAGYDGESGGRGGSRGIFEWRMGTDFNYYWFAHKNLASNEAGAGEQRSGAAGTAGTDGKSAASWGTFSAEGFLAADGSAGTSGAPGKGGKGGLSRRPNDAARPAKTSDLWDGDGGSGGGAGGCPGLAGPAGQGGGASVAAYLVASPVVFDTSELVSGNGGAGGRGSLGSAATAGGLAGSAPFAALRGSNGGRGGRSGVSGHGAGGPSIAIAHTGGEPELVSTKAVPGEGGAGVAAATNRDAMGDTKSLAASPAGPSLPLHAF